MLRLVCHAAGLRPRSHHALLLLLLLRLLLELLLLAGALRVLPAAPKRVRVLVLWPTQPHLDSR